jgi:hypothetical protein
MLPAGMTERRVATTAISFPNRRGVATGEPISHKPMTERDKKFAASPPPIPQIPTHMLSGVVQVGTPAEAAALKVLADEAKARPKNRRLATVAISFPERRVHNLGAPQAKGPPSGVNRRVARVAISFPDRRRAALT